MVTDGTHVCALCGEWSTGCSLCGQAPLVSRLSEIRELQRQEAADEYELRMQERSIRQAAEKRRGEIW